MATSPHDPRDAVYLVGKRALSILDLLTRFAEPEYQLDGIPRISDLHLKVGEAARYRFDDELIPLPNAAPIGPRTIEQLLFPLLAPDQIARLVAGSDVDAAYDAPDLGLSFRINAFHDREGLACAIRVLPRKIPALEDIGFPTMRLPEDIMALRQGLVIITGTTGSGKSTTIASLLTRINEKQHSRIITLEDPIEYVLPSESSLISQREVGKHVPSFHEGLRSALREDPDVIFVGEMRDPETTYLAMTAAETGHLVFSTLHTRDARGALSRIVDMYPPDRTKEIAAQMSFSMSYIIGQRLVARATGKGRRSAMEVLKNTPAVGHIIRQMTWQHVYSTMQTQSQHGMMTLERHLLELVASGQITREEAMRAANVVSALEA